MIANTQVLGVLTAYHPKAEHFNYEHECFFLAFSRFIAQTLSNVRHMNTLEEQVQIRTKVLEEALTETNQLKEKFEEMAYVDELTGLHNRRFFFPEAKAALSRAVRYDHPFTVMILDLDDFKKVNDNYGHPVGDLLLATVSNILKNMVREGDILARFGGEEFILALPDTDAKSAGQLADRILDAVRDNELNNEIPDFSVTCSAGLSCLSEQVSGDTTNLLDQMLVQADDALLECKANGKDQYYIQESNVVNIKANYYK
jgi:diguanylate cyclase (GGDEF)-like protein